MHDLCVFDCICSSKNTPSSFIGFDCRDNKGGYDGNVEIIVNNDDHALPNIDMGDVDMNEI